jgi:hypothetical protein
MKGKSKLRKGEYKWEQYSNLYTFKLKLTKKEAVKALVDAWNTNAELRRELTTMKLNIAIFTGQTAIQYAINKGKKNAKRNKAKHTGFGE